MQTFYTIVWAGGVSTTWSFEGRETREGSYAWWTAYEKKSGPITAELGLGKRSPQGDLFTADAQYLKFVGEDSFYGFLAREGGRLFRDEDFAALYCEDNGRTSVPPSLLAIALLLQTYDRVSDEEAKARADFDLRWKVALGIEIDRRPFAKSPPQADNAFGRSW